MSQTVVAIVVLLLFAATLEVSCLPGGAPAEACTNVAPNPTAHGAQSQPMNTLPYMLGNFDTVFATETDGQLGYVPGMTYQCKFV